MTDKIKDAYELGAKLGLFERNIKVCMYWAFPSLLKVKYWRWHNSFIIRQPSFIQAVFVQYKAFKRVKFIACEFCDAKGLELNSEKHGWKYHDYHIWSCPKCKGRS